MKLQTTYTTKLETVQEKEEISAILDAKLEATSPYQVVDYVSLAADNIEDAIKRIDEGIKELKAIKDAAKAQLEIIKEGTAEWLEEAGVDKLNGDIVSSISVSERKPKEEVVVTDEEAAINAGYFKTVVDKTSVKKALLDDEIIDFAHIDVTHLENSLRINKRRK